MGQGYRFLWREHPDSGNTEAAGWEEMGRSAYIGSVVP